MTRIRIPAKRSFEPPVSDARSVRTREEPPTGAVDGVAGAPGGGDLLDDADAEAMVENRSLAVKVAAFTTQTIMVFPKDVPLQYTVARQFYVRPCYAEYYDHVLGRLASRWTRGVTVTGTPGIGTSVFLGYFFLRYTLEHPNATIVMCSYSIHSDPEQVILWQNGKATPLTWTDPSNPKGHLPFFQALGIEYPHALVLMDGPPRTAPTDNQYVAFTGLNERWFSNVEKEPTHTTVVMPLWDEEELLHAVDALELEVHDAFSRLDVVDFLRRSDKRHCHEVLYRYDLFGGVARACLTGDKKHHQEEFVTRQLNALTTAAQTIDLLAPVSGDQRHRLFHYVPSEDLDSWSPEVASPYVAQLLRQRVTDLNDHDRERSTRMMQRVPEADALHEAMLVNDVHNVLARGHYLVARHLPLFGRGPRTSESLLVLKLTRSEPVGSATRPVRDPPSEISGGPYFRPTGKTFASIDGFYVVQRGLHSVQGPWEAVKIVVFYMAVLTPRPVQAQGLYAVLKEFCIEPTAYAQEVALVFAATDIDADTFSRQYIVASPTYTDTSPMTVVEGINATTETALAGTTVCTVGDLRTPPATATFHGALRNAYERAQTLLQRHDEDVVTQDSDIHHALDTIPQFVWQFSNDATP